jgi:hypothetical protein
MTPGTRVRYTGRDNAIGIRHGEIFTVADAGLTYAGQVLVDRLRQIHFGIPPNRLEECDERAETER